ncbi:MAG: large subunit ribosomal protein [Thermoplasmata archaeon]|jgi:large subunit ribosomal protein L30|nr:large subunit ribosomal protein [Thermoplasmata archaeon]
MSTVPPPSTEASRNAGKSDHRRSSQTGSFFLVRIRGTVNVTGKISDTLDMLHLSHPNHAVVIPKTESYMGMVNRVKDYVAYGDVDATTMAALIKARGRAVGDKPIDDAFVKTATESKFATVDAFAKAVADGKATLKDLGENAKPFFRLHPPTGGHEGSTKKHYTVKGELGYRGKEINELIKRMI